MESIVNICGRSYDLSIRTEVEQAVNLYQQNRDSVPGDIAARILAADHKIRGEPLMPEAFPPRVSLLFFDIDEKTFTKGIKIAKVVGIAAYMLCVMKKENKSEDWVKEYSDISYFFFAKDFFFLLL